LETGYRYRYRCDVIIAAVQRTYAYAMVTSRFNCCRTLAVGLM